MGATKGTTTTTSKTKAGPVVTTTTVLTSETLVLTKERRQKLEGQFLETLHAKATKVHALLDYAHYTKDQIVAAMYASADKTGDTIHVSTSAGSTMKRSLAVAKAWVVLKAGDLVEADAVDHVFQLLSQIADISPAGIEKYAVVDPAGKPTGDYRVITVERKNGTAFEFQPDQGSGEGAIAAILSEYLTERVRAGIPDALDWLGQYKDAVVFANNEKRRAGGAHNVIAADSRKGAGEGENAKPGKDKPKKREARGSYSKGKKGSKGNGKKPVEPTTPETPAKASKAKAPATPKVLTTKELVLALTKRIADYETAISVEEDRLINALTAHYEARFTKGVPVGGTIHDVKGKGKKRTVKPVTFTPQAVPTAKVKPGSTITPWSTESTPEAALKRGEVLSTRHMNSLLLTEQARGTITAKKRKQWMQEAFDGSMNNASFRTRLAKLQGRKILVAVG